MFSPPAGDFFEAVLLQQPQVIFSKLFYCSSRRQQKLSKKIEKHVVFLGFQTTRYRQFFGVVLELARPSEARCFPPGW